jgi:hypothetical protein
MTKPTTEEMGELICEIEKEHQIINEILGKGQTIENIHRKRVRDICQAVRRLIESSDKGPEVDEEFVEKWAEKFDDLPSSYFCSAEPRKSIVTMLREAGVEQEE